MYQPVHYRLPSNPFREHFENFENVQIFRKGNDKAKVVMSIIFNEVVYKENSKDVNV